jgi:hypothetical protein
MDKQNKITDVAPCLAHPCDSPGGQFACRNCAFGRKAEENVTAFQGNEIISQNQYGCRIGGAIFTMDGNFFMKVGNKIYPEKSNPNPLVVAAQNRLHRYVAKHQ